MLAYTHVLILAALLFVSYAKGDIIANSGNTCNEDTGADVACDGSCHSFANRHSFEVQSPMLNTRGTQSLKIKVHSESAFASTIHKVSTNDLHCVTAFLNADCDTLVAVYQNQGNDNCVNVNTGTNVQSFRCAPDNICES